MKRTQIKKCPMSDTTLATLEPETKEYREADGTWSFLGLGAGAVSGQAAA